MRCIPIISGLIEKFESSGVALSVEWRCGFDIVVVFWILFMHIVSSLLMTAHVVIVLICVVIIVVLADCSCFISLIAADSLRLSAERRNIFKLRLYGLRRLVLEESRLVFLLGKYLFLRELTAI